MSCTTARETERKYTEALTSRQKLKVTFLKTQENEREEYIADLEGNLKLNKQIIRELCGTLPQKESRALTLLNQENEKLLALTKKLRDKKIAAETEVLILQQTVQSYKLKELDHEKELIERSNELKGQMEMKECMLQIAEKRCVEAGYLILKHLHFIPEAVRFVEGLKVRMQEGRPLKISNVIEQNETLRAENLKLEKEIVKLKEEGFQLKERVEYLEQNNGELKAQLEVLGKECEELKQNFPLMNSMHTQEIMGNIRDFSFGGLSNISGIAVPKLTKTLSQIPISTYEAKHTNDSFG